MSSLARLRFLAMAIAVSDLLGWAFSIDVLKTIWPGGAQMKPNTAAGLAISGLSLVLGTLPIRIRPLQATLGIIVAVFGVLFLFEYATGREIGVDNFLLHDSSDFLPGRPSVATSSSFVAVGFALVLLQARRSLAQALRSDARGRRHHPGSDCAARLFRHAGRFLCAAGLFGFAIHTAASFLLLSTGILAAGSRTSPPIDFSTLARRSSAWLRFRASLRCRWSMSKRKSAARTGSAGRRRWKAD